MEMSSAAPLCEKNERTPTPMAIPLHHQLCSCGSWVTTRVRTIEQRSYRNMPDRCTYNGVINYHD